LNSNAIAGEFFTGRFLEFLTELSAKTSPKGKDGIVDLNNEKK